MKKTKLLALAFTGLAGLSSCGDFNDLTIDPNNPSSPETRFLFTRACMDTYIFAYNDNYNPWTQLFPQYLSERQNIQYSSYAQQDFNTSSYYYRDIQNLEEIISLNTDEATQNESYVLSLGSAENQIAVARTLRAYYYMHMTDILGMIPYSEALKGDEGNFAPKYDTQEEIYADLDKELTEAYAQFDESGEFDEDYDILYNGDIANWKKLNASLRMMMAIKLTDVDPGTGKERFARAYADGGITDNSEALVYNFVNETMNQNPLYDNIIVGARNDFAPSKTLLDQLLAYNDPRIEAYAEPNSDGEYVGVPFGINQADIANYTNTATFDPRYYDAQNTPITIISPSHILLIQAEAAVRGWIDQSQAENLYKQGIQASFDQYSDVTYGKFDAYYAQPEIALTGTDQEKIEKIGMQRWLANFMQDGVEAWSDWRRLNVPKIYPGPSASISHIPYRRIYYPDDYSTNMNNYNAAIQAQGEDSFETRVWWDVADNN